jgi:flagellar biosynthesis protein FlhF
MQVRVFESTDMASGLKLVRNGKLGLLGKPTIEITAAIDTNWPKEEPAPLESVAPKGERPQKRLFNRSANTKKRIDTTVGANDITIDHSAPTHVDVQAREARMMLTGTSAAAPQTENALRGEVNELKGLVQQLAAQLATAEGSPPDKEQSSSTGRILRDRLNQMKPLHDPVTELLHRHGVDSETARTIAMFAAEQLPKEDFADQGKIRRFVIRAIESLIEVKPPLLHKTDRQKRIALIGPTGVGKTTTLAKLAAHHLINHSNSVALITIDTYRIAAVEQLKVYGEIMHLPVEVVITPEQLEESLKRHADKSLILIDTAGRSPRDTLCIEELTSFLKPELEIEKHLVLSAATRENELLDTIRHFAAVTIDRTIFTKVDECMRTGVILNVQLQHDSPLSYITNGQRVPEDLLQITRRSVAELIMSYQEGITHD